MEGRKGLELRMADSHAGVLAPAPPMLTSFILPARLRPCATSWLKCCHKW